MINEIVQKPGSNSEGAVDLFEYFRNIEGIAKPSKAYQGLTPLTDPMKFLNLWIAPFVEGIIMLGLATDSVFRTSYKEDYETTPGKPKPRSDDNKKGRLNFGNLVKDGITEYQLENYALLLRTVR
ncbi:hypothetical protein HDV00_008022, partial [Rhizophlyctis rosea]